LKEYKLLTASTIYLKQLTYSNKSMHLPLFSDYEKYLAVKSTARCWDIFSANEHAMATIVS
jgi:hypothetical protein